ncbi:hypothetical protein BDV28DRAFT_156241 [Aspergillus coremiiformis]|uniref:Zn(2)-C6 fungal-type domain-containing protein n=1 Tax=Aspergillus coremiiformis TaxID=138285 RepID=A0A5N6ZE88_9EURO|nr:hypothetical protein BDV28DRAFT_156241 [Aspergillus coremiiformis]
MSSSGTFPITNRCPSDKLTPTHSARTISKRPPKLRAACNECHAAKVRCSGEKSGCQRCANLSLNCIFSISRIGKVPGKRSKANRAAAAAAAAVAAVTAPTSSTSSSSSTATSLTSPSHLESANDTIPSFQSFPHALKDEDGPGMTPSARHVPSNYAADSIIAPMMVHDYSSSMPFYSDDGCAPDALSLHEAVPTSSNHISHTLGPHLDLGLSEPGHFCWTSDLEPLSANGLPTPGLEMSASRGPLGLDRRLSHDWEMETNVTNGGGAASRSCTTSIRQPTTPPDYLPDEGITLYPVSSFENVGPESSYTVYVQLLHSIEQTLLMGRQRTKENHTLDAVLAANQQYLTTLLQLTESLSFDQMYDGHLLFTVALSKIITLFSFGYRDFTLRSESHHSMGYAERLIRFGVFEIDFVEQKAICRGIFLRELKRARMCLSRLMDALSREKFPSNGRHERLCEEMKQHLDQLTAALEARET